MTPDDRTHTSPPDATRDQSEAALDAGLAAAFGGDTTHVRPPNSEPEAGTVIAGKYRLSERVGEGGMGSVWVAHQTEPVKRKVAVKLIKAGMDSKAVLARFDAERQALAVMDHPHIAKVLDGGVHDGRPYFVMELVKGVPITAFCDARKLTPQQRLELFVPVCQAIQHAHQKGVIHRDIKPGNVLVALYDDKPIPKVIDFGVAKATGAALTEHTLETGFGAVVGTPQYMSPEQASLNNLDIDTRSDVYSLGVLLYELLTGSPPFGRQELEKRGLLEMLRVVREEEPPRPSHKLSTADALPTLAAVRGTEPKTLTGLLRSELDWIVMKALEKDRTRRYDTANGFAADVQRYLSGEPVQAHPPSTAYRLKKLARRHRGPVIAGSLVFLALVAGVVGTTIGLLEAKRQEGFARDEARAKEEARAEEAHQRAKAETAYAKAADVLDAMTSNITGESLLGQPQVTPEQKEFLSEVLTYYKEFAEVKGDDELSRVRAAVAACKVGEIEMNLGHTAQSERAFRAALDGFEALRGEFPDKPEYVIRVVRTRVCLGGQILDVGPARAEAVLRPAVELVENPSPAVAEWPGFRSLKAAARFQLANALLGSNSSEAEWHFRAALVTIQTLTDDPVRDKGYPVMSALTHCQLGALLTAGGKLAEAEGHYRQGLAVSQEMAEGLPRDRTARTLLALAHSGLVDLSINTGKWKDAEEHVRHQLAIYEKLTADYPGYLQNRIAHAYAHEQLAFVLHKTGRWAAAAEEYDIAITLTRRLPDDPKSADYRHGQLAHMHGNRGYQLAELGRRPEAETEYRQALTEYAKLSQPTPTQRRDWSAVHNHLGLRLADLGRRAEAVEQYRRALTLCDKLVTDFPTDASYPVAAAGYRCNIGTVERDAGRPADSLAWFGKAIDTLRPILGKDRHNVMAKGFLLNALTGRADSHWRLGQRLKAAADWQMVVELGLSENMAWAHFRHGQALDRAGETKEAIAALDRGLSLREAAAKSAGPDQREPHWLYLLYLIDRGKHEAEMGRHEPAVASFTKAVVVGTTLTEKWPSAESTDQLRWALQHRGENLGRLARHAEAVTDWERVIELCPPGERPWARARRAQSLVYSGKVAEGVLEADELARMTSINADVTYQVACVYGIACGKNADKKAEYSDTAMGMLTKAVKEGFKDPAHIAHMKWDPDLHPLREREDFKKLLADLEAKFPPKKETLPPPREDK